MPEKTLRSAAVTATAQPHRPFDMVCEGGGVKGIGLAGAYSVLEEQGYGAVNLAGTSAGAITAALIAAGYSAVELEDIVLNEMRFRKFEDRTLVGRVPGLGLPLSVLVRNGYCKGDYFLHWMRDKLKHKGVRVFGDLPRPSEDPKFGSRLQVIASDLTTRQLLVLPRDAKRALGCAPEKLGVAEAVRMSMSIPLFFEPVQVHRHVIVDGGMLSNFPVWLFDRAGGKPPRWPTFGLKLVEPESEQPVSKRMPRPVRAPRGIRGLTLLLSGMLHTMLEAHDRMHIEEAQYARTIGIPTLGVRTTAFDIGDELARELYNSGRKAAAKFLADWDFAAYVAKYRGAGREAAAT